LTGLGLANLNPLGSAPAGSVVTLGNLKIGDGQELGVYLSAQPTHVVTFQSVTLRGGMARFSPKSPDFGTVASVGSDLTLNTVTESVPGSGIIMNGLRLLTLVGDCTYTGPTIVSNGTVLLNGNLPGGGAVRVERGRFSGQGIINGSITINALGSIAPEGVGSQFGFIEAYGEVFLSGTTVMDLNKTGIGTSDTIAFSPVMHFGGTLQVNAVGGALAAGDEFSLFSFDSSIGTFSSIVPASPGPGLAWDTSGLYSSGVLRVTAGSLPNGITISASGSNVILSGTNGTPNSLYRVLSSTDIALPAASWTPIYTNTLSSIGSFSYTNIINVGEPQRFFILDLP
jgi:autotransporter-associated beta strand protein